MAPLNTRSGWVIPLMVILGARAIRTVRERQPTLEAAKAVPPACVKLCARVLPHGRQSPASGRPAGAGPPRRARTPGPDRLRHTGNQPAADMGVSTKNLMGRMGHDNERAALRYQHRSAKGDRIIADGLDALVREERDQDDKDDGEAAGTLVQVA